MKSVTELQVLEDSELDAEFLEQVNRLIHGSFRVYGVFAQIHHLPVKFPHHTLFYNTYVDLSKLRDEIHPSGKKTESYAGESRIIPRQLPEFTREQKIDFCQRIDRLMPRFDKAVTDYENQRFLPNLRVVINQERWNNKGKGFLSLFTKVPEHIQRMRRADSFEEIKDIAERALRTSPALGRDPDVQRLYQAISSANSPREVCRNFNGEDPKDVYEILCGSGMIRQ